MLAGTLPSDLDFSRFQSRTQRRHGAPGALTRQPSGRAPACPVSDHESADEQHSLAPRLHVHG